MMSLYDVYIFTNDRNRILKYREPEQALSKSAVDYV